MARRNKAILELVILIALAFTSCDSQEQFFEACLSSELCVDNEIGWYCPKQNKGPANVYKDCSHSINVHFNGGNRSCLEAAGQFNLFAKVDGSTATITSVTAVNDSVNCCIVTIEYTVSDIEGSDVILTLTAGLVSPFESYVCDCSYAVIVHDEILPVKDIKSSTECDTLFVYWIGTPDYTYNVSIPELNIFNRSTDIAEIKFDLLQEGIDVNTSYTVIVQPSVCGWYGNSSSADIIIAMEPRMSDEVQYAFSSSNSSHLTTVLVAKVALPGCFAAYPNELNFNFTCSNNVLKLLLPVTVLKDGTIMIDFSLPQQRCDGCMTWQNKHHKNFNQLITIVTTEFETATSESKLRDISFRYFSTCCFVTSHTSQQPESFCHLPSHIVTGYNTFTTFHECNNDYSVLIHDYDIHPTPPSSSSSTGPTSTQMTSTYPSCTCTATPGPTNEPNHSKICLSRPLFSIGIVLVSVISFFAGIGIAVVLRKIIPKLNMFRRKQRSPTTLPDDHDPETSVRIINANLSGRTSPTLIPSPINGSHTEQGTVPGSQRSLPPVMNDGTSSNLNSSSHSTRPLLSAGSRGSRYTEGPASVI